MSSLGIGASSLGLAITSYLSDPSNFPPEFKNWVTAWVETFPPNIPLSQVVGYSNATTYALVQTPGAVSSGTVETAFTWGSAVKDAAAMFSTGANTKLTCKQAGTYQVSAFLDWGTNATGVRTVWIRRNGSTHVAGSSETPNANGCPQSASDLVVLAVGDYLEVTGFQNSGGSITPSGFFSAVRVSP